MNLENIKSEIHSKIPDFSGVISLSKNGVPIYEEAFGHAVLNEAVPNNIYTRFPTASGSKIFTAVAILRLVESGELSLEDPVLMHLPDHFPFMDNEVTIRHLITHTSGFEDYFDEEENDDYASLWSDLPMYGLKSPDDFLVLLKDKKMEFKPGDRFKYNDGGFVILSMIIEAVTKKSFLDVIEEHIFTVAGMENSGYFAMNDLPGNTALGYYKDDTGHLLSNIYTIPIIGGGDGGGYSTVSDIMRFWETLLQGKLIHDPLLKEMLLPKSPGEEDELYGYGVWLAQKDSDITRIYVVGADPGISMISDYDLETDLLCTILSNRDDQAFHVRDIIKQLK
ncbi:MAG TPA: serine hydrolase [Proteiniclasticum sp.]|nr:serine hydrolase [Proteiniclasticum sp.]